MVDDQVLILKATRKLVNWEALGIGKVFTAGSASQAREIFAREQIDIMLADIEMPGEDGLSLRRWQAERYPETSCIFLTSHADFAYAQEAIRGAAFDYILQPASIQDIEEVLRRCVEYRKAQGELMARSSEYEEKLEQLVESYVTAMFFQKDKFLRMAEWKKDTGTQDRGWWYLPCLVRLWGQKASKTEAPLCAALEKAGFAGNGWRYTVGRMNDAEIGIVFCGQMEPPALQEVWERLEMVLQEVLESTAVEMNFYLGCYAGEDLPRRIAEVTEYAARRILQRNALYRVREEHDVELRMPSAAQWGQWLTRGDGVLIRNQITNMLRYAQREQYLTIGYMQRVIHCFLEACSIACYEQKWEVAELFGEEYSKEKLLRAYDSVEELEGCVEECLYRYQRLVAQRDETEGAYSIHERMQDILHYLEENMSRMISRREAAKYVMLNEDYFSRIFRKETGMGYKEYLLQQKMNYAKKLLTQTDMPITLVASRVGYDNFTNFSQMFRKYTGFTPSAWRKEGGESEN
ncbi:MAG: helix-turn-helix domain-containing protein [Eubacteriales bacterium]|nr:helix-turn-helix domain-containing protein [Eubacteriales bacterium]